MLMSHDKKFIYIKTVKTAGSSVEAALEGFCRNGPDAPAGVRTPAGIVGMRGEDARKARWFHHMPARRIRERLPRRIWRGYATICNIRNPWDKTVSWYHFRHPEMRDLPEDQVISGFRDWLGRKENLGFDFGKYTIQGRPVIDIYLRYDRLAEDFAHLCDRLGLGDVALPHLKGAARGDDRRIDYRAYYDTTAQTHVAEAYAPDIDAFGWRFDDPAPARLPPPRRKEGTP